MNFQSPLHWGMLSFCCTGTDSGEIWEVDGHEHAPWQAKYSIPTIIAATAYNRDQVEVGAVIGA